MSNIDQTGAEKGVKLKGSKLADRTKESEVGGGGGGGRRRKRGKKKEEKAKNHTFPIQVPTMENVTIKYKKTIKNKFKK